MLPAPKQYVVIPYGLYKKVKRTLEEDKRYHLYKDKRLRELDPSFDRTRDGDKAAEINALLFALERQSKLDERLG